MAFACPRPALAVACSAPGYSSLRSQYAPSELDVRNNPVLLLDGARSVMLLPCELFEGIAMTITQAKVKIHGHKDQAINYSVSPTMEIR